MFRIQQTNDADGPGYESFCWSLRRRDCQSWKNSNSRNPRLKGRGCWFKSINLSRDWLKRYKKSKSWKRS